MLSDLDSIQLGVAYRDPDGRILPSMPADIRDLEAVEVVYEQLPGWRQDISGARSWEELPPNAKKYIRCVRHQTVRGCYHRAADRRCCRNPTGERHQVAAGGPAGLIMTTLPCNMCRRIEELVGVQCTWIGVGPGRAAMVAQPSKVLVTAWQ